MSLLKLALLFAVYVSLDFSNPMMPGAVSFADEPVKGRQTGRDADAGTARLPATTRLRETGARPVVMVRARSAPPAEPLWQAHVRRLYTSASGSTAPSEDH